MHIIFSWFSYVQKPFECTAIPGFTRKLPGVFEQQTPEKLKITGIELV